MDCGSWQYVLYNNTNNTYFEVNTWCSKGYYLSNLGILKTYKWYHIAIVVDDNNKIINFYVNGIKQTNNDYKFKGNSIASTLFPLAIGRHIMFLPVSSTCAYPFHGKLDDIRIYNRALTDCDVYTLYNTPKYDTANFLLNIVNNNINVFNGDTTIYATKGFKDYQWYKLDSNAILSNADSLVVKQSGKYYCIAKTPGGCPIYSDTVTVSLKITSDCPNPGSELIVNGNFENGVSGYYTDYSYYNPNPFIKCGAYYIDTSTSNWQYAGNHKDHTTGHGKMMIIDGAIVSDINLWQETITTKKNTDYIVTLWALNIVKGIPPTLDIYINDVKIGNSFIVPADSSVWENATYKWYSGNNTSAIIKIIDQSMLAYGNDFAIDDISFKACCTIPTFQKLSDVVICYGDSITLGGTDLKNTIVNGHPRRD